MFLYHTHGMNNPENVRNGRDCSVPVLQFLFSASTKTSNITPFLLKLSHGEVCDKCHKISVTYFITLRGNLNSYKYVLPIKFIGNISRRAVAEKAFVSPTET